MTRQTIDTNNYFEAVDSVGVEKLPRTLRSSHEYVIKQTDHGKDWSKFGSDQAFTRLVKIIFKKLGEFLNSIKHKGMEGTVTKRKFVSVAEESAVYDIIAVWKINKLKPRNFKGMRSMPYTYGNILIDISDDCLRIDMINKKWVTNSKHHSIEELYSDFDEMTTLGNYQFKILKGYDDMLAKYKASPRSKTEMKTTSYADIDKECYFIERFLAFHDQILYKNTFGIYIDELQKAISTNKIRKTSPVAKDIMDIQNAMVKQFNTMHNATHFVLSPATIKRFKGIVAKWQNSHKDIDQDYAKSKKKSVGLNGLEETAAPIEILPSKQFADMQFTTIGLKDKWRDFIGDPCPGFTAMVFGMPKMGKSYLCVDFASYLAKNHGKVLYVSKEEFMSPTLALKIKDKDAANENLDIAGSVPTDLSAYQFVFLDSVTSLKLTPDELKKLQATYPAISFVYVFQVTKAGSARGTNEYMHNVDVVIEIPEKGKAVQFGRFNQGGKLDIFNSLPVSLPVEDNVSMLDGVKKAMKKKIPKKTAQSRVDNSPLEGPAAFVASTYSSDTLLFRQLNLKPFKNIVGDYYVGEVVMPSKSTVKIWVHAAPALFWKFEIFDSESGKTTIASTGSGRCVDFWPTVKLILENMFVVDQIK